MLKIVEVSNKLQIYQQIKKKHSSKTIHHFMSRTPNKETPSGNVTVVAKLEASEILTTRDIR